MCEGSAASFTVTATGTGLTYQWKKNGVDIVGATGSTYTIPATVTASAGTYTVVVSGTCTPGVTSSASVLTINEAPEVIHESSEPDRMRGSECHVQCECRSDDQPDVPVEKK
ncbi:MAG: immunoglobulin domain-containing protein [Cyclobacteriaceae bacterium]|nr:immunoglobulin domain-containing protein [Cyclobacteriaceae bacterium]